MAAVAVTKSLRTSGCFCQLVFCVAETSKVLLTLFAGGKCGDTVALFFDLEITNTRTAGLRKERRLSSH
jgi:hypothetical protein